MNRPGALMLRPARTQEASAMASMSRRLIEGGLDWRYTPQRIAALMADAETLALVAREGSCLQGFAVMQFGDTEAHLVLLCVEPAQRRRGIGRRLTEWLLASARVAGIDCVSLELRDDNAAALAFYAALGFTETALAPGYYEGRISARRMRLALGDRGPAPSG